MTHARTSGTTRSVVLHRTAKAIFSVALFCLPFEPLRGQVVRFPDDSPPASPCVLGVEAIDVVVGDGRGMVRFRIRNAFCTGVSSVRVALVAMDTVGVEIRWDEENERHVALPPAGETSPWIYVPFSFEGDGASRFAAWIAACGRSACDPAEVSLRPEELATRERIYFP